MRRRVVGLGPSVGFRSAKARPFAERTATRRGYTLIELLVVVMIVLILIAATLPVAKRVMESSRTREASRQLNAHLAMARTYAARNGRPFGLWMEYDTPIGAAAGLHQVTRVYLAEVQPPYAGGTTGARGIIRVEPTPSPALPEFVPLVNVPLGGPDMNSDGIPDAADLDNNSRVDEDVAEVALLQSLIHEGESFLVKFDFKGDWYRCQRGSPTDLNGLTDPLRFYYIAPLSSTIFPPAYNLAYSPGHRYQILRQPRRVGSPLELANGTCIDVEASGFGPQGTEFGGAVQRLIVLFSPGGAVDGLYLDSDDVSPPGTLHFLVGETDKEGPPAAGAPLTPANSNLADPNSLWVSVGRLNGSITSSENYPDEDHALHHSDPWITGLGEYIEECRAVATGREQMGGQ